jgi:hypothetical protein
MHIINMYQFNYWNECQAPVGAGQYSLRKVAYQVDIWCPLATEVHIATYTWLLFIVAFTKVLTVSFQNNQTKQFWTEDLMFV